MTQDLNVKNIGRTLGLDLGEKTIGVALSDERGVLATPLVTLTRIGIKRDMKAIAELVAQYQVQTVVIGLPLHMDGSAGEMAENVETFLRRLRGRIGIPIETWDERMSTLAAERALIESDVRREKRRLVVDQAAATLILQGWLDRQHNKMES